MSPTATSPHPLPDLQALRQRAFDQVLLIFGVLLTVAGILSFYRNLSIAWSPLVFVNLVAVPLVWLLILARRRLSYRRRVVLTIIGLWTLAINAMLMVGPAANAKSLIILVVLVTMLFLSQRAGWLSVIIGAVILGAIGAAAVTGLVHFDLDYQRYVRQPAVWLNTVFTFTAYAAVTAFIAARLLHSLDATVGALNAQTAALHATQERLRAALNRQRAIFNNSSAGVALIDGERTILEPNACFCALLGYRPEELIGQSTRLIHRDEAAFVAGAERFYRPLRRAGRYSEDLEVRRHDGSCLWVHASLSALDPAALEAGAVLVLVDIDQRKRAELALAAAKDQAEAATRAKSRVLATVTHELRTPLHSILGFAAVLDGMEDRAGAPADDLARAPSADAARPRQELLATIARNSRHLLALVNDVLDLECGRLTLDPQPTALHALLRHCLGDLAPLADAKGLDLHLDLAPGLPPGVWIDGRRLTQVLTNLLGNAIRLTAHGEVRLVATAAPATPGQVALRLTVADTGPGLPAAEQTRLQTALAPTGADPAIDAPDARGLGLVISQGLARQMGGRIELDSVPGVGSRFTLILPALALADCAAAAPPAAAARPAAPATPPPPPALAELRELAEFGRTTRIEDWCRHWSAPGRHPAFAARVLQLAHAFEHAAILDLVDAAVAPPDPPPAAAGSPDP